MKVYFLISGLLRTFIQSLYPFLVSVEKYIDCEFIVCTTDNQRDTKYTGISMNEQISIIIKNPKYKFILESENINFPNILTQREKNTICQWYHLQKAFIYLKSFNINDDDIIIRIRPDINIFSNIEDFIAIINKAYNNSSIYIPIGNDLFNEEYRKFVKNSVNDHIAIGKYKYMKDYCNLYSEIYLKTCIQPIISEKILYDYLLINNINITRVELKYNICLSECKLIAIGGDSGVGKTTLANAIQNVFPYDSNLILETDRYHKWNRSDENWNKYTHLNPNANFLEHIIDDTYKLKIGEDIEQVDYDHKTGKFTKPELIESKPYLLLCGLHTLYSSEIRCSTDIKLFIDVEDNLKRYWKISRDINYRGYFLKKAIDIYNSRVDDFNKYILPQKNYADIIISYSTNTCIPENISDVVPDIQCSLLCTNKYAHILYIFLEKMSTDITKSSDKILYKLKPNLYIQNIKEALPYKYNNYISKLEPSYIGVIQCAIILILFN